MSHYLYPVHYPYCKYNHYLCGCIILYIRCLILYVLFWHHFSIWKLAFQSGLKKTFLQIGIHSTGPLCTFCVKIVGRFILERIIKNVLDLVLLYCGFISNDFIWKMLYCFWLFWSKRQERISVFSMCSVWNSTHII